MLTGYPPYHEVNTGQKGDDLPDSYDQSDRRLKQNTNKNDDDDSTRPDKYKSVSSYQLDELLPEEDKQLVGAKSKEQSLPSSSVNKSVKDEDKRMTMSKKQHEVPKSGLKKMFSKMLFSKDSKQKDKETHHIEATITGQEKGFGESTATTTTTEELTQPVRIEGLSEALVITKLVNGELPSYQLPRNTSKEAEKFLSRCFKIERKERPTASELLSDPFVEG